ncbi:MAG: hypothetical protein KC983_09490 [Phycisphaerales bacterium]|nr:hypothetical protein [Phycisphaerales bacterium]
MNERRNTHAGRLVALIAICFSMTALVVVSTYSSVEFASDSSADSSAGTSAEPSAADAPDPQRGLDFILHGDYVGSGYPTEVFLRLNIGASAPRQPYDRAGVDPRIPIAYNAFTARNGVEVVGGFGCLACHASMFRGELVMGMGNSLNDWASTRGVPAESLNAMVGARFGEDSDEYAIYRQFMRGVEILYPHVAAPFKGVNPAFRIEEIAASHRHPDTLAWSDEPLYDTLPASIASDVPPWWHVQKKSRLYYNGMGRGSFAKLMAQINVVGIQDNADAARTVDAMDDVIAYMKSLTPPTYPGDINDHLAARGERVFVANCSECHGTYGPIESYPNRLVPVEEVGTDPTYADMHIASGLAGWYNRSWYATTEPTSSVTPKRAYIAPPLDGIWCTAPYFHNGSVPTLDTVINSTRRPTFWSRSFDDADYDLQRLGWTHEVLDDPDAPDAPDRPDAPANTRRPSRIDIYDTTITGYGNMGHTFGDDLSDDDRAALLEYLKTL